MDALTPHSVPDLLEYVSPELQLDDHPASDAYVQGIQKIKQDIVAISRAMPYSHVKMCKLYHRGAKNKDIAKECDVTTNTVSRVLRTEKALKLQALMMYLQMAFDGVSEAQRRNTLWRIAQNNEHRDPRVSIAAVAEINKMEHNKKLIEAGAKSAGANTVEIVINNNSLPRGALDD